MLAACLVATTGCGAVERSLADEGDVALVDDASARASQDAPPPPAQYLTRPVDFLVGDRSDAGGRGTLVSPGGMCGFLADGSWRAGVAGGSISLSPDARDVAFDDVDITGEAPGVGDANEDGSAASVQQTPIPAVALVHEYRGGPEVEHEGLLEVSPDGLEATFTAGPTSFAGPEGASAKPTDLVVHVACGARTDGR